MNKTCVAIVLNCLLTGTLWQAHAISITKSWSKQFGNGSENAELAPDGKTAALGVVENGKGIVYLIKTSDASTLRKITFRNSCSGSKCNEVESMAFSADGKYLCVGGNKTDVKVYEVATGNQKFSKFSTETDGMRADPTGKFFAVADHGKIMVIDIANMKMDHIYGAHGCGVNSIDFTPDGKTMVSGACDNKWIKWEVNGLTIKKVSTYKAPGSVKTVRVSADGKYVITAVGGYEGVILWSIDGKRLKDIGGLGYTDHAEFSPDGRHFVSQGKTSKVHIYSVPNGSKVGEVQSRGNGEYMNWRGNQLLVASSGGLITLFKTSGATTFLKMGRLHTGPQTVAGTRLRIGGNASEEEIAIDIRGARLPATFRPSFLPAVVENRADNNQ